MAKKAANRADLQYGASMLYLLYGNKQRAWRETAGFASDAQNSSAAQPFFDSDNAQRTLSQAQIEFDELLDKHLAEYAKKKGLFFPTAEALDAAKASSDAIRRNIEDGVRSKEDVIMELNGILDTVTDPNLKKEYYKMYIDATNMKRSEDNSSKQASIVVLPERNNITIMGYELHIASDKKPRFVEELKKAGVILG